MGPPDESASSRRTSAADGVPYFTRRPNPRRDSVSSNASFYSDVEMAQDEVFAGPTSESLPSSAASFYHRRRSRTDSETTWSFYQPPVSDEDGLLDEEAVSFDDDLDNGSAYDRRDSESLRRKSSDMRQSVDEPLLRTRESMSSDRHAARVNQKAYIASEDLTIVIAGFRTRNIGYGLYFAGCLFTLGALWVILRWIPRWRVKLVGWASSLGDADWVVVENQWGESVILDIQQHQYGQPLSSIFGVSEEALKNRPYDDYDDDPLVPILRYVDYRYIRFFYHPVKGNFSLSSDWKDSEWESVKALRIGLDGDTKTHRQTVFGENVIDIEEKSVTQLLFDEAFHPFYVFQIFSLVLWSVDEYYYYAVCIFIISAFTIVNTIVETKSTMRRLREVSRFVCDVRVLRNGFWRYVSSADLVPGDVYEVTDPGLSLFPCDSFLLTGDCIVNESMLTGESVPVSKTPVNNDSLDLLDLASTTMHPAVAKHFLFCGTKIIRARRPHDNIEEEAVGLAMVLRTGFNTTKGALVRSMLFPKPSGFNFYRDAFKYIAVMGLIAAIGFIASFINFIRLGMPWYLIVVRALDLITIVVPPALPATLSIGTSFALSRLRKNEIFCISPQRVNVSGKIDVMCFDKTGTLTEDGLDVLGVHCVEEAGIESQQFSKLLESADEVTAASAGSTPQAVAVYESLFNTMTTCHSLRVVDGELLGDPLDLKMFQFTGWEFEEGEGKISSLSPDDFRAPDHGSGLSPSIVRPAGNSQAELGILKSFEFDTHLRRTSVIVKRFRASGGHIYVKGAPECMREICNESSFPVDFDQLLEHYTHRGYRVIACATKHIKSLTWIKAQKMKREEAESGLKFSGFIIFENKLKPQTTPVIEELGRAAIRKVMCTGDNILTAISVAKNCRLIDDSMVFVPHFLQGDSRDQNARLQWQTVDEVPTMLDEKTLLPLPLSTDNDVSSPYVMHNLQNYSMAVTGDVFRWIIDYAPDEYINRMLVRSQVFARMSPDEKHELVEKLQSIGYCVGFCGDGANDCGALKAADVGISLSEAEASVAAPFTSRIFDISCVPQVIREGRAALVTSFACFKYMSIYSAIQFASVSILYKFGSNLGDFQFLFIDLFLILPIAVFMGWSGPYPRLSRKRPTASLVSRKVLTPLLGQIVLAAALQMICYKLVKKESWYIPPVVDEDKSSIPSSPNTTLFLYSCFQYVFAGVALSVGPPYRMPMRFNLLYLIMTILGLLVIIYMMFLCPLWLYSLMQLTHLSMVFKLKLLALALVHLLLAYYGERHILPQMASLFGIIRSAFRGRAKVRKKYKVLEEEMRL